MSSSRSDGFVKSPQIRFSIIPVKLVLAPAGNGDSVGAVREPPLHPAYAEMTTFYEIILLRDRGIMEDVSGHFALPPKAEEGGLLRVTGRVAFVVAVSFALFHR
jgi:hypothetical protein